MSIYEVPQPRLNSPFEQPKAHWNILKRDVERLAGRRRSLYYYRDPKEVPQRRQRRAAGIGIGMIMINRIRQRLAAWRLADYAGVTDTTRELLDWWRRAERKHRLFFAQLEAAETIIFLTEAAQSFQQGISIPPDEPSEQQKSLGYMGFLRYACKMATGTGKSTVMAMLVAWSVLNKVSEQSLDWCSDSLLIVCPTIAIREQLSDIDPAQAEQSLYSTRDLVPMHLMSLLKQG